MEDFKRLLNDFKHHGGFWSGTALVPCLKSELPIWLLTYEPEPTPRQLSILRAILAYPKDLRADLQEQLFKYYQTQVYGSADHFDDDDNDVTEERAPRLKKSHEIWRLVEDPEICIADYGELERGIEFKIRFACTWDDEHGLGVKYKDWAIVKFGNASI
jgi:hypothetical protein